MQDNHICSALLMNQYFKSIVKKKPYFYKFVLIIGPNHDFEVCNNLKKSCKESFGKESKILDCDKIDFSILYLKNVLKGHVNSETLFVLYAHGCDIDGKHAVRLGIEKKQGIYYTDAIIEVLKSLFDTNDKNNIMRLDIYSCKIGILSKYLNSKGMNINLMGDKYVTSTRCSVEMIQKAVFYHKRHTKEILKLPPCYFNELETVHSFRDGKKYVINPVLTAEEFSKKLQPNQQFKAYCQFLKENFNEEINQDLLIEYQFECYNHNDLLIFNARRERLGIIKQLICKEDIDINYKNKYGVNALFWCAYKDNNLITRELMKHYYPDIDFAQKIKLINREFSTALDYAYDTSKENFILEVEWYRDPFYAIMRKSYNIIKSFLCDYCLRFSQYNCNI